MNNIVVGIEGLVGSGKTSICREMLNIIPNSVVFHGGNLYRAIVYTIMQNNKDLTNNMDALKEKTEHIDIKKMMDLLKIEIKIENRETVVYVDGIKIDEDKIQSEQASMAVSVAGGSADNTNLFIFARNLVDTYKENYNVILSGRALNSIYPEINYHFFITADLDERVKRKAHQYGEDIDIEDLKKHIIKRDELQEKAGFYKLGKNTIVVDVTECKSAKESADKVCKYIKEINKALI